MATIVTRTGKGSALTFAEGDANFTNLNNDKLENITNESLGDLSDVQLSTSQVGTATSVDDVRDPNTITLTGATIPLNTRIQFSGADVTTKGLAVGIDYYIVADIGGGAYELSTIQFGGADVNLTNAGGYGDITYTAFIASPLVEGDVLTYSTSNNKWQATTPAAPVSTAPSVALIDPNFSVITNTKIQISKYVDPDGFVNISNDSFNLDPGSYLVEVIGRIRNNADFSIGFTIPGVTSYTIGYPFQAHDSKYYMYSLGRYITLGSSSPVEFQVSGPTSGYSAGDTLFRITKF